MCSLLVACAVASGSQPAGVEAHVSSPVVVSGRGRSLVHSLCFLSVSFLSCLEDLKEKGGIPRLPVSKTEGKGSGTQPTW